MNTSSPDLSIYAKTSNGGETHDQGDHGSAVGFGSVNALQWMHEDGLVDIPSLPKTAEELVDEILKELDDEQRMSKTSARISKRLKRSSK